MCFAGGKDAQSSVVSVAGGPYMKDAFVLRVKPSHQYTQEIGEALWDVWTAVMADAPLEPRGTQESAQKSK